MNEKILEEFEKIIFVTGQVIVCPSCNTAYSFVGYGIDLSCKNEGCNGVVEPPSFRYKKEVKAFLSAKLDQARTEERERYTEDINFLKKLHSMELDALSLKSLEDFMKWADNRRHTPISPILSSLQDNQDKE